MSSSSATVDYRGYLNSTYDSTNFFDVNCAWPISGQYCLLNRALFYVLLVFALVMRRFPWLVAGALASALTYSGTAALHAMGLAWYKAKQIEGEEDAVVLWAILSSGCVLAVPLLNWSSTIRNELRARPIILWWYLLTSVGFFCALYGFLYGWQDPIIPEFNWAMCHPGRQVNATETGDAFVDRTFVQKYNCTNPCSSEHVVHRTQFRARDSLLLLNVNQTWGKDRNQAFRTFVGDATQTSFIALPIVVIQGLYTILFGAKTPHEVRNTVFRFFAGHGRSWKAARPIKLQPWHRYAAQFFGLLIYTLAVLALILCPILFVVNVVAIELTLTDYHDSEEPWLIGQWSPIAAALLAVLAAFLSEYWARVTNYIRHCLLGAKADRLRRHHHTGALTRASTGSNKPDIATKKDGTLLIERRSSGDPGLTTHTHRENTIDRIVGEWKRFLAFLYDPVEEALEEMRKRKAAAAADEDHNAAHHNEGEGGEDLKPSTAVGESSELMLPTFHQQKGSSSFHSLPNEDDDRWKEMTMIDIENVAAVPRNAHVQHAKTWAGRNLSREGLY